MIDVLALDCETTLIPPSGKVRTAYHVPDLVVAAVAWRRDGELHTELTTDRSHLELLCRGARTLVFHNAPFDLAVLAKAGLNLRDRVLRGAVRDTIVLYKFRYPLGDRSATLDAVYSHLFPHRAALEKGDVRTSFVPGQPLTAEQKAYALADAAATLEIHEVLAATPHGALVPREHQKFLMAGRCYNGPDPDELYSTATALLAWHMEPQGVAVSPAVFDALDLAEQAELKELTHVLYEAGLMDLVRKPGAKPRAIGCGELASQGWPKYPRRWTPHQPGLMRRTWKGAEEEIEGVYRLAQRVLRERVGPALGDIGVAPELSEKTGAVSLRYDFLKQYRTELPEDVQTYLDYSKSKKAVSSLFTPMRTCRPAEGPWRVHGRYWIPGAETGRWSCSGSPFHRLSKDMRRMFRADPGHVFVSADYKSLELYTLCNSMAAVGIRGALADVLERDGDVHDNTAAIMGTARQDAKMANFGLPGGMGVRTFLRHARSRGCDWDADDARRVRNRWFEVFPDVQRFLRRFEVDPYSFRPDNVSVEEWLIDLGFDLSEGFPTNYDLLRRVENGEIYTVQLPSGRVIPRRIYSAAANVFFQGPGAEVITLAFVQCIRADYDVRIVVHDSIVVQAPEDAAQEVKNGLEVTMQQALARVCPQVRAPRPEASISEVFE